MTIEERLDKLEQKLARAQFINRLLAVLGIGVLLMMWLFASGTPTAQEKVLDEVKVQQFIVVHDNGNNRAILAATELGPGLALADKNGTLRAGLTVSDDGPILSLFDQETFQ